MNDDSSSETPADRADDGDHFDEPDDETRRRNWITAGIILALVVVWVLFGLRKPLFG